MLVAQKTHDQNDNGQRKKNVHWTRINDEYSYRAKLRTDGRRQGDQAGDLTYCDGHFDDHASHIRVDLNEYGTEDNKEGKKEERKKGQQERNE